MQRTEPTSESRPERQFLTPLRAFAVGMILIGLFLGLWLVGQSGNPEEPPNTPVTAEAETDVPTDAEALDEFDELRAGLTAAYTQRDATLIPTLFTPSSPMRRRVNNELARLAKENLRLVPKFKTLDVRATSINPRVIRLEETLISDARFVDSAGRNITAQRSPQRQTIVWELHAVQGEWRLHESEIVRAEDLKEIE